MAVSLKVPVQHLIDNAEAQLEAAAKRFKRDQDKWVDEQASWRHRVTVALDAAAQKAADGKKLPETVYAYRGAAVKVFVKGQPPEKPQQPPTARIERDLKVLRATSQSEVSVRAGSELERYL